jgi:hypothetical protein
MAINIGQVFCFNEGKYLSSLDHKIHSMPGKFCNKSLYLIVTADRSAWGNYIRRRQMSAAKCTVMPRGDRRHTRAIGTLVLAIRRAAPLPASAPGSFPAPAWGAL